MLVTGAILLATSGHAMAAGWYLITPPATASICHLGSGTALTQRIKRLGRLIAPSILISRCCLGNSPNSAIKLSAASPLTIRH
jgi:hypothetical protein